MKRILVIAVLAVAVAVTTFALSQMLGQEAASSGSAAQEVKDLVNQWDEAFMRRDTAALDRILADDFTYTDSSGAVLDRTQYMMSLIKSPDIAIQQSYTSEDVNVRVYGDTAVVTGRSSVKGRSRGKAQFLPGQYRFTDVWVKRQGRWQAVATQGTSIAQQ